MCPMEGIQDGRGEKKRGEARGWGKGVRRGVRQGVMRGGEPRLAVCCMGSQEKEGGGVGQSRMFATWDPRLARVEGGGEREARPSVCYM